MTAPTCHLCHGVMGPIVNHANLHRSEVYGCEHCDGARCKPPCKLCAKLLKTVRIIPPPT